MSFATLFSVLAFAAVLCACKHIQNSTLVAQDAIKASNEDRENSAVIYVSNLPTRERTQLSECNAVPIDTHIVITAAHCIYDIDTRQSFFLNQTIRFSNATFAPAPFVASYQNPFAWEFNFVVNIELHPVLSDFLNKANNAVSWDEVRADLIPDLAIITLATPLTPAIKRARIYSGEEPHGQLFLSSYGPSSLARSTFDDRELSIFRYEAENVVRLNSSVFAISHTKDTKGLLLKGDSGGPLYAENEVIGLATYSDFNEKKSIFASITDKTTQDWISLNRSRYKIVECKLKLNRSYEIALSQVGSSSKATQLFDDCPTLNSTSASILKQEEFVRHLGEQKSCPSKSLDQFYVKITDGNQARFVNVQALSVDRSFCTFNQ